MSEEEAQTPAAQTPAAQAPPPAEGGAAASEDGESGGNLEEFGDIKVEVSAILGNVNMPIEHFLKLGRGAIIELGRHKDEDIDILINGHAVAKGEITVIDERVGVSVTKVLNKDGEL